MLTLPPASHISPHLTQPKKGVLDSFSSSGLPLLTIDMRRIKIDVA